MTYMINGGIQITHPTKNNIPQLAELHCTLFPTSRSTQFGRLYVKKMFRWFLENYPELSFFAVDGSQVIGYVVGAIGGYGRRVFRYAIFELIIGFLIHPNLWVKKSTFLLWRSYLQGILPARKNQQPVMGPSTHRPAQFSISLADIGVAVTHQGRGIGKELTSTFEKAARELGAGYLSLSVMEDNLSARKVYEACGWVMDGEFKESRSVHYEKKLS